MKDILDALHSSETEHNSQALKITKSNGLTISEWRLLTFVVAGNNTQESLAIATNLDISTLSRQLKRLVEKKMMDKIAIGKDKRQLVYNVTELGTVTNQQIKDKMTGLNNRVFDLWTDEEKNLLKILINRLDKSVNRV